MKHRTNESSELNGVQQHNGTFSLRWLQEKSNGARIKLTLSANLMAAIKANGNCQCSPLLGLDPFWMKAVTKTLFKDHHCWYLSHTPVLHPGPFMLAGKIVEAFSIRLEASGKGIFLAPSLNFQSS